MFNQSPYQTKFLHLKYVWTSNINNTKLITTSWKVIFPLLFEEGIGLRNIKTINKYDCLSLC